jgi:hypothetical protein
VTSPHLPSLPFLDVDPSRCNARPSSTPIILQRRCGRSCRDADVFLQASRPQGLAACGSGPEDCAALRPGIEHAFLKGFSPGGPWEDVKSVGFFILFLENDERRWTTVVDSLGQMLGGFDVQEAEAYADYVREKQPSWIRIVGCPCKRWITQRGISSQSASSLCSARP